ncbi:MAG TPA: hypothetical protein VGM56_10425 [Byssovorax sp.]
MRRPVLLGLLIALAAGCAQRADEAPDLSKPRAVFHVGEHVPEITEREASGPIARDVARGTPAFSRLVKCTDPRIVFKDEEHTGADRMMTPALRDRLERLAALVPMRWPGVSLRVTEAWDEDHEHGSASLHYEGRAADLTTSDVDPEKLAPLAELAVAAGFSWVFFEDASHVHASVRR